MIRRTRISGAVFMSDKSCETEIQSSSRGVDRRCYLISPALWLFGVSIYDYYFTSILVYLCYFRVVTKPGFYVGDIKIGDSVFIEIS